MTAGNPYEEHHVAFVSSETGTSASEVLHVLLSISILPFLASVLIPWIVPPTFSGRILGSDRLRYAVRVVGVEYPIVMLLPLFIMTVMAGEDEDDENPAYPYISYSVPIIVLVTSLSLIVVNHSLTQPRWTGFRNEWTRVRDKKIPWLSPEKDSSSTRIPFITSF